jgi:hypothetical protein
MHQPIDLDNTENSGQVLDNQNGLEQGQVSLCIAHSGALGQELLTSQNGNILMPSNQVSCTVWTWPRYHLSTGGL